MDRKYGLPISEVAGAIASDIVHGIRDNIGVDRVIDRPTSVDKLIEAIYQQIIAVWNETDPNNSSYTIYNARAKYILQVSTSNGRHFQVKWSERTK